MQGQAWTIGRVDLLRKLWAEGRTASVIAACLGGTSRSAVLGKIFRLRLGGAGGAGPTATAAGAGGQDGANNAGAPARRRPDKREDAPAPPPPRGKALLQLTNDSCRWPHGRPGTSKFHFCGAAGADLERGLPYCPRHMRRAYGTGVGVEDAAHPRADGAPPYPVAPAPVESGAGGGPSPPFAQRGKPLVEV